MKKILLFLVTVVYINSVCAQDKKLDMLDIIMVHVDNTLLRYDDGKIYMHVRKLEKKDLANYRNVIMPDFLFADSVTKKMDKILYEATERLEQDFLYPDNQPNGPLADTDEIVVNVSDSLGEYTHILTYLSKAMTKGLNTSKYFSEFFYYSLSNETKIKNFSAYIILDCQTRTFVYESITYDYQDGSSQTKKIPYSEREIIESVHPQGTISRLFDIYCYL